MLKIFGKAGIVAAALVAVMWALPAQAQATRTWISGVGDDVNPCSRTAPCKTFAGAIVKTAAGGEVDCLDPGGFGAVTITKSITLDCGGGIGGQVGSILNAAGNGINVSAGVADKIKIRNLSIQGVANGNTCSGAIGVRFNTGANLIIEHVGIFGQATAGVDFEPQAASTELFMADVETQNNCGDGFLVKPSVTGPGSAKGTIINSRSENNAGSALRVDTTAVASGLGATVVVNNSTFSDSGTGVTAVTPAAGSIPANITMTFDVVSNNAGGGVVSNGNAANIRMGITTVSGNATGIAAINSGKLQSTLDNYVFGNTTDTLGAPTAPNLTKT